MSQVREPLPPGPGGPEQAPTENSSLISLPRDYSVMLQLKSVSENITCFISSVQKSKFVGEVGVERGKGKTDQETAVEEDKDISQPSSNQSIQAETQEQSIWGNRTDGDLIRRNQVHRFYRKFGLQQARYTQPLKNKHNLNVCLSQMLQHWKGVRKKVAKSKMAMWIDSGLQRPPMSPIAGVVGGVTARVPLLRSSAPSLPLQGFRSRVRGGSWLGLCAHPAPPDCGAPVAPAGASVQGSAGALCSKPLLKTSAVTLIVDCCVHCILACLFCEFLTLCNIVLGQASCGICSSEACCCCCGDEVGDDCNCPCDMDCGIMDACCESSDCLEICMECCGICFPSIVLQSSGTGEAKFIDSQRENFFVPLMSFGEEKNSLVSPAHQQDMNVTHMLVAPGDASVRHKIVIVDLTERQSQSLTNAQGTCACRQHAKEQQLQCLLVPSQTKLQKCESSELWGLLLPCCHTPALPEACPASPPCAEEWSTNFNPIEIKTKQCHQWLHREMNLENKVKDGAPQGCQLYDSPRTAVSAVCLTVGSMLPWHVVCPGTEQFLHQLPRVTSE
ncbi:hypothetical protein EK904_001462 [Melospiza melodia maxima]|nr:hypothetical protein EK904_001462 [Melospiza melodia maxima]